MAQPSSAWPAARARRVIVLLLLGVASLLAWRLVQRPRVRAALAAPAPVAVPASVQPAASADVPRVLLGVGTVQARRSVTVRTQVDGRLDSIDFTEGQPVRAGQVLARIDARALRAQFEQARAAKARDQAQLADARLELRRSRGLVDVGAASRQSLDSQRALTRQLAAAVQADSAQVDYARVQLGYATIRAPIGGLAGARLVDAGNIVHAGDPAGLVVINQIDPIDVAFSLPGQAVQAINLARGRAPLQVLAYAPGQSRPEASGTLVLVNNQVDAASGTIALKARFPNPRHLLWPGQYVRVRLVLGHWHDAVTVPDSALQHGQSGSFVYVVDAGHRARVRPVVVGQEQDGIAVIAEGLKAGERVVVDGQYKLSPGALVRELAPR
ncbi:efflux RND transporter periplasmic adaptor subunit [Thiomonas sp.]|uniref:efflux RND transporter periplasmic adaptor subunit n=1 Tax=Thiomonas sp. TaxID=2047785 RepID=UPI00262CDD4C|nr:efflux RND transporter periplasmic adaptor subunit [Thiomonas sp.]